MPKLILLLIFVTFITSSVFVLATVSPQEGSKGSPYAGEKRCKKCHIKRHKSWSKDRHAKAFESFTEPQQKNPECLKCHTTGYGEGGFVSMEETPELTAVQCEQCHGPGVDHIPLMSKLKKEKVDKSEYPEDMKINKRPTVCIKCHSPHEEHIPID